MIRKVINLRDIIDLKRFWFQHTYSSVSFSHVATSVIFESKQDAQKEREREGGREGGFPHIGKEYARTRHKCTQKEKDNRHKFCSTKKGSLHSRLIATKNLTIYDHQDIIMAINHMQGWNNRSCKLEWMTCKVMLMKKLENFGAERGCSSHRDRENSRMNCLLNWNLRWWRLKQSWQIQWKGWIKV